METNFKDFTTESSKWLNAFIKDMSTKEGKKKLENIAKTSFPGNSGIVIKAIEEGPDALRGNKDGFFEKDVQKANCKTMFNFIEFCYTGGITPITVNPKED